MKRLDLSDEARDVLPTAALERIIALRQHTELVCSDCGEPVPPEDSAPVSVVVRFDAVSGGPVAQFAHAHCSPSKVDITRAASSNQQRLTYVTMLRAAPIPAVLIWEPTRVSIDVNRGETLDVAVYRQLGFRPSDSGIRATAGPKLDGWMLRNRGPNLILTSAEGALEQFEDVTSTAPAGWFLATRAARRCLLIVGETLGLDRPSPARIDALLADGRAVAATVEARLARH